MAERVRPVAATRRRERHVVEPPVRDSAPLTHWSAIAAAQGRDPKAQQALDELCRVYWPVIYAYLRRLVNDPENAADLTQGFFARLLERNWLAQADAARGRFRSFLRAAARNYWLNERRAAAAAKRGGGWRPTPIELAAWDERLARTEGGAAPDAEFDREWAVALLARASDRLDAELSSPEKRKLLHRLRSFLAGVPAGDGFAAAARDLGISEAAVRMAVTRLRQAYRAAVRAEVAPTVASSDAIDDEIRELFAVWGR